MIRKFLIGLFVTLVLVSCKGTSGVIGGSGTADSGLAIKSIISAHKAANPNFKTLASRVKVAYENDKQSQSITVSLRIEKDAKIWIKASVLGITLAKALVTPNRVSYYETLGNTYFDGDFSLLSDWLGTELNFEKTQAILLGQSIFELDSKSYVSKVTNNAYKLEPKIQPANFLHTVMLNPENFKVNSGSVTQSLDNRSFSIWYGAYQQLEGSSYPTEIQINSKDGNTNTQIEVIYRNIDLNVAVSFPFEIPEDYEEIQLD